MTYSQPLPKYVLDSTYSPSSRSYISCPSPSTFSDQFQSYLRCCLRGCSPQYAPSKTTLSSHCAFFFFSQCWRGPRVVILPLPKAASFSFPLPKLLVTTSWGGWSQGWRRGQGQTQEQVRLCPVTTADVSADRLPPSSWRPSCAQVVAQVQLCPLNSLGHASLSPQSVSPAPRKCISHSQPYPLKRLLPLASYTYCVSRRTNSSLLFVEVKRLIAHLTDLNLYIQSKMQE